MGFDAGQRLDFIRANLRPVAVPFAPGLRYHAAHPGSGLSRLPELFGDGAPDRAPYWAHLWPGGAALIRYFQEAPETVRGRRVLDFGCGSGLVGIAAAKLGAGPVICADSDPMAVSASIANAALNRVGVEAVGRLSGPDLPAVDLVAAGDVFYDAGVAAAATGILTAFRARGAEVLVGDIGRAGLPLDRLERLAAYPVRDVGDSPTTPMRRGSVFRFS